MRQDQYEKTNNDLAIAKASITVFKAQIKLFEKKFLSDRHLNGVEQTTKDLSRKNSQAFEHREPGNELQKNLTLEKAVAMKKGLQNNINRIDLLTDSRIGEIKSLLKEHSEEILKLTKRISGVENDITRKEYE